VKWMSEENEWDHRISAGVMEVPVDCIRISEVCSRTEKDKKSIKLQTCQG